MLHAALLRLKINYFVRVGTSPDFRTTVGMRRRPPVNMRPMTMMRTIISRSMFCLVFYLVDLPPSEAFQLVTDGEAALPDDLKGVRRGGVTLGPDIIFISPSPEAGLIRSPLSLTVKFKAHGGAHIDPTSILITYMKVPRIDITQRVSPFVQSDGVQIETAELPPAVHRFRFDVRDTDGRKTSALLSINVEK
jgi:hypothetical protein